MNVKFEMCFVSVNISRLTFKMHTEINFDLHVMHQLCLFDFNQKWEHSAIFFVKFRVFTFNNLLRGFTDVTCVTSEVQRGFNPYPANV